MEKKGDEIHVDEVEATGGSKEGVVRYMLLIGTGLAIVLLSVIWMTGALTFEEPEPVAEYSPYQPPENAPAERAQQNPPVSESEAAPVS